MNVLLLNLTRFGDLLQSAAAVRALAHGKKGEKNRVGIICLENFTAGAELLADVAAIYPLPAAKIMNLCNAGRTAGTHDSQAGNPASWLKGLGCLHEWVENVQADFMPDAVCNLSPSSASSLLGRLFALDKHFEGFALDNQGEARATNLWAGFILGASTAREASPFHIVDMFRKAAQPDSIHADAALTPVATTAVNAMRERLFSLCPAQPKGFVALQLGASADIRRWPVKSFAALGDALWKEYRFLPILLGTKGELPLSDEYETHAQESFINLIGQTDLTELAATLTLSSLCVSNDTGTLHLASGLAVPSIGLFLATAQPWDTAPYAVGSYSLEPDLPCHPCNFGAACPNGYACHTAIRMETVLALASTKLQKKSWDAANFAYTETTLGSRVWESASDKYGFANIISLSGHENQSRTQWMRLQRHLYRQFFDKDPKGEFAPTPYTEPVSFHSETGINLGRACGEILALFDVLLQQAEMLSQNPLPIIKDRFFRTWQRLASLLQAQPLFSVISFSWQLEALRQENMEDTIVLARQYRNFFAFLRPFLP